MRPRAFTKSDAMLVLLYSSPRDLNITQIAKHLRMYYGNASKVINNLEGRGYVTRHKYPNTKETTITLTTTGRRLAKTVSRLAHQPQATA